MGLSKYLHAIAMSLLMGLQAVSAAEETTTVETAKLLELQNVQHRQRMGHRAIRHKREAGCVAVPTEQQGSLNRIGTKADAQPLEVLIEAVLVKVKLNKDNLDMGVNFALLDRERGTPEVETNGTKVMFVGGATKCIRALKDMGETTVLATPRLLVLDKQLAEIHLGDQLGYKTNIVSGTSTIEETNFINIGTQLRTRPMISSDRTIRLEVHAEQSTGHLDDLGIPQMNAIQLATTIALRDGATVAIGGPISTETTQSQEDLPLLSGLPYIGGLFHKTADIATHEQLIMLLTARIVTPKQAESL